jgi:hypothetical protein
MYRIGEVAAVAFWEEGMGFNHLYPRAGGGRDQRPSVSMTGNFKGNHFTRV